MHLLQGPLLMESLEISPYGHGGNIEFLGKFIDHDSALLFQFLDNVCFPFRVEHGLSFLLVFLVQYDSNIVCFIMFLYVILVKRKVAGPCVSCGES